MKKDSISRALGFKFNRNDFGSYMKKDSISRALGFKFNRNDFGS